MSTGNMAAFTPYDNMQIRQDHPQYYGLLEGICPHTGRSCDALADLSSERTAIAQRCVADIRALDAAKRTQGLDADHDAVIEVLFRAYGAREVKISRVLGGSCAHGCEIAPPPAG